MYVHASTPRFFLFLHLVLESRDRLFYLCLPPVLYHCCSPLRIHFCYFFPFHAPLLPSPCAIMCRNKVLFFLHELLQKILAECCSRC